MVTNDEIKKKLMETNYRIFGVDEPLTKALNEARDEGYKEGYTNALMTANIDEIKQLAELILKALEGVDHPAANDDEGDD